MLLERRGGDSNPRGRFTQPNGLANRSHEWARPLKNKEKTSHQRSLAPSGIHDTCQTDPDLTLVNASWDRLPAAVKAGIVAMVQAASM